MPSSSLIRALMTGWAFSAWAAAFTKNGIGESLTPSRAAKASLARARSFISLVMSTSTTEVSWAWPCSAFIMLSPMTLRMRVILTVWPRSGEDSRAGAFGAAAAGAGAAAGAWAAFLASAAARTSCLRMRPPTPEPLTEPRSTPFSVASLRTSGVTYAPSSAGAAGAGVDGTGVTTAGARDGAAWAGAAGAGAWAGAAGAGVGAGAGAAGAAGAGAGAGAARASSCFGAGAASGPGPPAPERRPGPSPRRR